MHQFFIASTLNILKDWAAKPNKNPSSLLQSLNLSKKEWEELSTFGCMSLDESNLDTFHSLLDAFNTLRIQEVVMESLHHITSQYPLIHPLTIKLWPMDPADKFGRNQLQGVSAFTTYQGEISLIIAPLSQSLPTLEAVIAHEYHHHWRIHALHLDEENETLLERMILEGLADHFAEHVVSTHGSMPWTKFLNLADAEKLWPLYRQQLFVQGKDTSQWLFGSADLGLPLWTGYAVGYEIIQSYRESHPLCSWDQLTIKSATDFLESPFTV
ncbi:DUF2268 domain-containing putative Zn-dependent protease [Sulfobacillus thermosulfidooxidans]|uniref:DUF2268 domain-containing putative Zn-dependent protease n=1 Tax=Sulfobacillus thermosulfidooxidans TaxID=28034 RepID=UPI0006B4BC43|nr:DUF2268 domain-containing putative Zn-dependent protease [Sulfobacillus thermosulfidooxidans]